MTNYIISALSLSSAVIVIIYVVEYILMSTFKKRASKVIALRSEYQSVKCNYCGSKGVRGTSSSWNYREAPNHGIVVVLTLEGFLCKKCGYVAHSDAQLSSFLREKSDAERRLGEVHLARAE
jgi:transposase